MKEQPKKAVKMNVKEEFKTFEDAAFEMLSTVSPVKLPREDIPFDSVREIVLNEVNSIEIHDFYKKKWGKSIEINRKSMFSVLKFPEVQRI